MTKNQISYDKKISFLYIGVMFLISPFITCIISFKNYRAQWSRYYVWFFIIFSSFTFVSFEDSDSNRYRDAFLAMVQADISWATFNEKYLSDNSIEFIEPLISFLTSKVSSNPQVLFLVYGIVFGFFYTKNIWFILSKVEGKGIKKQSYIFLVTFCFIWGIWDINVFRYTTAALMFLTGLLPYLVDKKKHYLWISVLSIFMHFSFVLPLVVFVIFSIFGDRTNFYFFIFLIGLFISEIDLAAIRDAATILPAAFQEKTNEYANEEFVEYRDELDQEKVWYAVYYQKSLRWVTSAILIYWYWLYRRNRFYTKKLQLLFSFSLLFYGVFLILTGIPVMKRFLFTGSLFVFALQFIYLQTAFFNRFLKLFVIISILPLLFFCVVKSRIALVFISANSIFGNPVSSILSPEWDSLLIFFKNLL